MELNFDFSEDEVIEAESFSGGGYGVLDTGIYEVTINHAALDKTAKGNNTISLGITTSDGHETTIYSAFGTIDATWASGTENYGYKDFQAFMSSCGAKTITPTPYTLKKDDGTVIKELSVVKELHGKKCVLAIQKELDVYNGQEKERNLIHSSYDEKGRTYLEAKGNLPAEKKDKVAARLQDKLSKAYKAQGSAPVEEEPEEMTGLL